MGSAWAVTFTALAAAPLSQAELAAVEPEMLQGTNLQHALMLARRHLDRYRDGEPVILVVTDGEPTAHLARDGQAEFAWPPLPETLALTREYTAEDPTYFVGQHTGSDTLYVADLPHAVHPCRELMNVDFSAEGQ